MFGTEWYIQLPPTRISDPGGGGDIAGSSSTKEHRYSVTNTS